MFAELRCIKVEEIWRVHGGLWHLIWNAAGLVDNSVHPIKLHWCSGLRSSDSRLEKLISARQDVQHQKI